MHRACQGGSGVTASESATVTRSFCVWGVGAQWMRSEESKTGLDALFLGRVRRDGWVALEGDQRVTKKQVAATSVLRIEPYQELVGHVVDRVVRHLDQRVKQRLLLDGIDHAFGENASVSFAVPVGDADAI